MKVITRHIKIRTHVQEWTCVSNPTCPVITFTGHKPLPYKFSTEEGDIDYGFEHITFVLSNIGLFLLY